MHYTSTTRSELEAYNKLVSNGENYDGTFTTKWAEIKEHQNGIDYAILKNDKYPSDLQVIESLDGWFNDLEIL